MYASTHNLKVDVYHLISSPLCLPEPSWSYTLYTWFINGKGKAIPEGFMRLRLPGFSDSRHTKVARLLSLRNRPPLPRRKYPRYSFLLEMWSTPATHCGQQEGNKKSQRPQRESKPLVEQCLNQLRYRYPTLFIIVRIWRKTKFWN
jgi:hypothetical protein